MFKFVQNFLAEGIINIFEYLSNKLSAILIATVLNPVSSMEGLSIDGIISYISAIGISYCTFKFLKKLLMQYMFWTDGDSDNPVHILVINYIISLALIFSFDSLYEVFTNLFEDIATNLVDSISGSQATVELVSENLLAVGFFGMIVIIIGAIMYFGQYISCLTSAILLLVLRLGFPLVASGVMDSNNGILGTYMQKFVQLSLTIIVKMTLLKLGLFLLMTGNPIWAIVVLTASSKVTDLLKEFMLTTSGGGGMGRLSGGIATIANIRRIAGK